MRRQDGNSAFYSAAKEVRRPADLTKNQMAWQMLPDQSNMKKRYDRQAISEKVRRTVKRTLQERNMSGEMTLGTEIEHRSPFGGTDKRDRAMGHNPTQIRKDNHTGWSDDDLFVAAMESPAFLLFEAEIDESIEGLIKRWAPQAAPNAQLLRRSFKFPSAKPVNKSK